MDANENVKTLMKLVSPFSVIVAPIVLYLFLNADNSKQPLSPLKYYGFIVFCIFGFFYGVWGCWALGWFNKK